MQLGMRPTHHLSRNISCTVAECRRSVDYELKRKPRTSTRCSTSWALGHARCLSHAYTVAKVPSKQWRSNEGVLLHCWQHSTQWSWASWTATWHSSTCSDMMNSWRPSKPSSPNKLTASKCSQFFFWYDLKISQAWRDQQAFRCAADSEFQI